MYTNLLSNTYTTVQYLVNIADRIQFKDKIIRWILVVYLV